MFLSLKGNEYNKLRTTNYTGQNENEKGIAENASEAIKDKQPLENAIKPNNKKTK